MKSILIATPEKHVFQAMAACFPGTCRVHRAGKASQAIALVHEKRPDVAYIDLGLLLESHPGEDYRAALHPFWQRHATLEIIVLTSQKEIRKAVKVVKAGARDYLTYPINAEEVRLIADGIQHSMIMESELDYLRDQFWQLDALDLVKTKNVEMQKVFQQIRSVAPTRSTVLLVGETGTGKTALAKLIHQHSNRRTEQFISVHCGAIPDNLLESDLFGHEKGAFTGAIRRKLGKFEIAKGGTIFLDEIGTITPAAQIKLLQILQDGTFQRVGGEETLEANVRILAATNTDLKHMSESGDFRKDLYYRLNVFPLEIPPLGRRVEDIPLICETILKRLCRFESKQIKGFDPRVFEAFSRYAWPGNIRELENLIERAFILEASSTLRPESFPQELFETAAARVTVGADATLTLAEARQRGIEDIERSYLKDVLTAHSGKINLSAQVAGISTRQLNKLMNKYGLKKEVFKRKI